MPVKNFKGVVYYLTVTKNGNNNSPSFTYFEPGNPTPIPSPDITITEPTMIVYQLANTTDSPEGLRFIGTAFENPFNGVIEQVNISSDGQQVMLNDLCEDTGTAKYRLILSSSENNLFLTTPDPQVINREN